MIVVRYFASEWCMTSLFQKGKIYGMWRFSLSFTVSSCTTKPLSSQFWLNNAEENVAYLVLVQWWGDDRQVSQSGKPLCTGASLWAVPKLAMGRLPIGTPANLPVEKLWLILFMKNRMINLSWKLLWTKKDEVGLGDFGIIQKLSIIPLKFLMRNLGLT